jgi:hypothetical protein
LCYIVILLIPLISREGPYNPESPGGTFGNSFGVSVSNYPATSIGREGDPICDCYRVNTYQNALITLLCDGCGWGEKSKQAALRVATNVTKHLSLSMRSFLFCFVFFFFPPSSFPFFLFLLWIGILFQMCSSVLTL